MQPNRQYNQPQTYGVYFTQSAPQPHYQHHGIGTQGYQPYGSGATQYYPGQPIIPVRYPHLVPYQHNTSQNYGGQPYMGHPSPKPFPEHTPQVNLHQIPPTAQPGKPFPEQNLHYPPPLQDQQPPTPPPPQSIFTSPVSQGTSNPYAWSTAVTPPSPGAYFTQNSMNDIESELETLFEGTSPLPQTQLPPRLKMLGQVIAQTQGNNGVNVNTNFNTDPSSVTTTSQEQDNKDIFKQKASQCGIFIESPPKPEDIESHLPVSNEIGENKKNNSTSNKQDQIKPAPIIPPSKANKRPRDEETECSERLTARTVVEKNLEKVKVRDDWWSVSDTSNLSAAYNMSKDDSQIVFDNSLNDSKAGAEVTTFSSFPDSSVDISKVLAESSANVSVDSGANCFDGSVDYIEEHEFLSFDVTTSPFPLTESDDNESDQEFFETQNNFSEESPEDPLISIQCDPDKTDLDIGAVKVNKQKDKTDLDIGAVNVNKQQDKTDLDIGAVKVNKQQDKTDLDIGAVKVNKDKDSADENDSKTSILFLKFYKQLQQSESKKGKILGLGVESDENIDLLAAAIVSGVIAKAAIEVIDTKRFERVGIEAGNSEMLQDKDSSANDNCNTNAETKVIKGSSSMLVGTENNSTGISNKENSNDEGTETGNSQASSNSESFDQENETCGRHRLYSWPYSSDNESSAKTEGTNDIGNKINEIEDSENEKDTTSKLETNDNVMPQGDDAMANSESEVIKQQATEDFEKYYFKQKASQHGIQIVSPLKRTSHGSLSSESDTERIEHMHNIRKYPDKISSDVFHMSRSQSESSDLHSLDGSDSQVDPSDIFKHKASMLGIKIQNPKRTIELSAENSDAELEGWTSQNKGELVHDFGRQHTSTPEPDGISLNPQSPEFRPGWRKNIIKENSQVTKNSMRADAPEFNPDAWNTSSSDLNDSLSKIEMRPDAPEFKPENSIDSSKMKVTATPFEPLKTVQETLTTKSKIFHIPTPAPKQQKFTKCIQASPDTKNCSVNTRRVKTKDNSMSTGSCYSRDVCVNTDADDQHGRESQTLLTKSKRFVSKNTNTDVPKRRSIAVNVNMSGGYYGAKLEEKKDDNALKNERAQTLKMENDSSAMKEQIRLLQVEVMKHRANLHVTRLFLVENNLQKEAKALVGNLKHCSDKHAIDTIWSVIDAKLNYIQATVRQINAVADDTIAKIRSGIVLKSLPDFSFYSDDIEQNRIISNQELFKVATGETAEVEPSPIRIDFSPTNKNLIRFSATRESIPSSKYMGSSPKNYASLTMDSAVQTTIEAPNPVSPIKKGMVASRFIEPASSIPQKSPPKKEITTKPLKPAELSYTFSLSPIKKESTKSKSAESAYTPIVSPVQTMMANSAIHAQSFSTFSVSPVQKVTTKSPKLAVPPSSVSPFKEETAIPVKLAESANSSFTSPVKKEISESPKYVESTNTYIKPPDGKVMNSSEHTKLTDTSIESSTKKANMFSSELKEPAGTDIESPATKDLTKSAELTELTSLESTGNKEFTKSVELTELTSLKSTGNKELTKSVELTELTSLKSTGNKEMTESAEMTKLVDTFIENLTNNELAESAEHSEIVNTSIESPVRKDLPIDIETNNASKLSEMKEMIDRVDGEVTAFHHERNLEETKDKPKTMPSLMDLDLDSDEDDVTEVSTALTDEEELYKSPDTASGERKYIAETKDLKDLITSKMNEAYGELDEHKITDVTAAHDIMTEERETEKTEEILMVKESNISSEMCNSVDNDNIEEIKTLSKTETDSTNLIKEETAHLSNERENLNEREFENKAVCEEKTSGEEIPPLLEENKAKLLMADTIDKTETEQVGSESNENIQIDLDDVYLSPDVHTEVPSERKDSNMNDVSQSSKIDNSLSVSRSNNNDALPHSDIDSSLVNSTNNGPNQAYSDSSSVSKENETILNNNNALPSAPVASTSAVSLVSSVNNALPSAMAMIPPPGNNVAPQSLLMNNIDPVLYQLVLAQLMQAYPDLAANPDMLSSVAVQQTNLLQFYMASGQISAANVAGVEGQGGLGMMAMLGGLEQVGTVPQLPLSETDLNRNNSAAAANQTSSSSIASNDTVNVKLERDTGRDSSSKNVPITASNSASSNGLPVLENRTSVEPPAKPLPYRPPGFREKAAFSDPTLQNKPVNAVSSSNVKTSENPFSASKRQTLPDNSITSIPASSRAKTSNTVSRLNDCNVPLRRPFTQSIPVSHPSVPTTGNNQMNHRMDIKNMPPGLSANNEPLRRPFKETSIPVSGASKTLQMSFTSTTTSNNQTISANLPNTLQGFKPVNSVVNQNRPVKTVVNQSVNPSDTIQGFKPVNTAFNQNRPVKTVVNQSVNPSDTIQGFKPVNTALNQNRPVKTVVNQSVNPPGAIQGFKPVNTAVNQNKPIKTVVNQPMNKTGALQGFKPVNTVVNQNMPVKPVVNQSVNEAKNYSSHPNFVDSAKKQKTTDFLPQYAKRHSPELRDKFNEQPSRDFMPNFVKTEYNQIRNNENTVSKPNGEPSYDNHLNYQRDLPPRFRRMSAPQRQSSTEEDWDGEIDEFPETKTVKFNPKRQLHLRSSSSRKPVANDTLWNSGANTEKNQSANSTNPLMSRSTPSPSECNEGTSGLSDIPLPKKLRTSEDPADKDVGGEQDQEWCEVTTKKKKQKELKKFSAPYVNSAPIPSLLDKQQKQSNFERLVEKIIEKNPSADRSEVIDSITKLREQKGGNLKGMNLQEIVSQACNILEQQTRSSKIPGLSFRGPPQRSITPKLNIPVPNVSSAMVFGGDDEEICVICHDPLSYLETKSLDCRHVFHSHCISQWVYGRERTCPTCRQHALFPEEFPRLGK